MNYRIILVWGLLMLAVATKAQVPYFRSVEGWQTRTDKKALLASFKTQPKLNLPFDTIQIDEKARFQPIEGFGFTLTGGSAQVLNRLLSPQQRDSVLYQLFGTGPGFSYLRLSIGASDLNEQPFTYLDKEDSTLTHFSLGADTVDLIPILKKIKTLQPDIQLIATPWTAPIWMKTNQKFVGGSLSSAYYASYAAYFVKYLQTMAAHGLPITAITPQNEPENPHNNPSMLMTASEQTDFIKNHLGPALKKAGLTTKIIIFDHNCDHPEYPLAILADSAARSYIHGSAFHLYAGDIAALSKVHQAHPEKAVYFTEQWVSAKGDFGGDLAWHAQNVLIGSLRHHARAVFEWNLAADAQNRPYTEGGCSECLGALRVHSGQVEKNVAYYVLAHASTFIKKGGIRLGSTGGIPHVVCQNTANEWIVIAFNKDTERNCVLSFNGRLQTVLLPAQALVTYRLRLKKP